MDARTKATWFWRKLKNQVGSLQRFSIKLPYNNNKRDRHEKENHYLL